MSRKDDRIAQLEEQNRLLGAALNQTTAERDKAIRDLNTTRTQQRPWWRKALDETSAHLHEIAEMFGIRH